MRSDRFGEVDNTLDGRDIDGEPFGPIMAAIKELSADDSLLLINSFEPEPLYDVLVDRGYEYETAHPSPDEWQVEIRRA
ncbi:MAG: DUF2249 domain-containing protein [Halodesulfurarchaeum sp.]